MQISITAKSIKNISWLHVTIVLILLIGALGVFTFSNYGISTDEWLEIQMVVWHLQSVGSDQYAEPLRTEQFSEMAYYGLFFNLISIIPYILMQLLQNPDMSIGSIISEGLESGDIYVAKHLSTFLFSLLTYIGLALFTNRLLNWKFASLSVLLLALTPRFWGHSFFNPKDIPFAALFVLTSYFGVIFVQQLITTQTSENRSKIRSGLFVSAAIFGSLAGLLTCVRIGGFVILGFTILIQILLQISLKEYWRIKDLKRGLIAYSIMFFLWGLFTWLWSPIAWSNPLRWFMDAISFMSQHHYVGYTMAFGHFWSSQDPPPYYLPLWFGITIPLSTLVLATLGWVTFSVQFFKLTALQRNCFLWLSFEIFALPLIAILKHSPVYGYRHFMFVVPAVVVFATAGVAFLLKWLRHQFLRISFLTAIAVVYSAVCAEMIHLHPYEYIFFNSFARMPELARNFETDYWTISSKEAIEWINRQPGDQKVVYMLNSALTVKPYAAPQIKFIEQVNDSDDKSIPLPFYYLAVPRRRFPSDPEPLNYLSKCEIQFQVKRNLSGNEIPLSAVKQCQTPDQLT